MAFNENMNLKERMEGGLSKMVNDPSTRLAMRNLNEREASRYRLAKNSYLALLLHWSFKKHLGHRGNVIFCGL